jgi:hypothetical protein
MLIAGRCRMCMKGISATANICPWCHTTTSYGKRRIATRTLHAKLNELAVWFAVVLMRKSHRRRWLGNRPYKERLVKLAEPTAG